MYSVILAYSGTTKVCGQLQEVMLHIAVSSFLGTEVVAAWSQMRLNLLVRAL